MSAARADEADLVMVWTTMHDSDVRTAHKEADGQRQPVGDKFDVGGARLSYPGDPTAPIELWINCRCMLRPDLISQTASFRDVSPKERKKDAGAGRAMPDGSYPIDNCQDLRNAIQAIGRAKDPSKVKSHIRKRKSSLGCPDVEIPDTWDSGTTQLEGEVMADPELGPEPTAIPFHSVLAPEGVRSGDGRRFTQDSLRFRPLPLPLTWQKTSADGHDGNITVARIDSIMRVGNEMHAVGEFLNIPEADEVIGLIADFGQFGVSIDADDSTFELNETDDTVDFTSSRICAACIVPIPAFAEAWVKIGSAPEEFMAGTEVEVDGAAPTEEALVAAALAPETDIFKDLAPGKTEDGPGWLTHPVDTERLRHYWVHGEGAAKIGWGTPGDFNRCRLQVAKYVKPQYLNGYCANRHYDALGFWPGRPVAGETKTFDDATDPAPALTLVAGAYPKPPKEWFTDPGLTKPTALIIEEGGRIYGHLAKWGVCHLGYGKTCTVAPHSQTGYANFLTGQVMTDGGLVNIGNITMGGGHAPDHLRAHAAAAHYDSTSTAVADIAVGEDDHGIWFAGWMRPGIKDEVIAELRASGGLSGDWRYAYAPDGTFDLDLIAALAVNVPGFPVPRVAASVVGGQQMSLVAAGYVEPKHDLVADAATITVIVRETLAAIRRSEKMAALAARMRETEDAV